MISLEIYNILRLQALIFKPDTKSIRKMMRQSKIHGCMRETFEMIKAELHYYSSAFTTEILALFFCL